jgi:hypothetical protein
MVLKNSTKKRRMAKKSKLTKYSNPVKKATEV